MSCSYAEGLSTYENKGVLGTPEVRQQLLLENQNEKFFTASFQKKKKNKYKFHVFFQFFDDELTVNEKCEKLAQLILASKHTVVHTGAGISTSAGIPDFRGPNGVWTLERKGEKPEINISFEDAIPTITHMALKSMVDAGYIQYIISQNIDGLHLKSGLARNNLAELHGNMFIEQCNKCRRQYIRNTPAPTVGQKLTGGICKGGKNARPCRSGKLLDTILDWEADLPEQDLDMGNMHSTIAELNITLGTTLQIVPSGNLPLRNKKFNGFFVVCNLQPTKHNKKADLIISTYVDNIMTKLMKRLGLEIPEYLQADDPTKKVFEDIEWTIPIENIKEIEKIYNLKLKDFSNKKRLSTEQNTKDFKTKVKKEEEGQKLDVIVTL